jgi:hypothetical protein
LLFPGDDPDKIVAAIAKQGESHAPSEAAPPDSSVVPDVVKTGAKVGETCLVLSACVVYAGAEGIQTEWMSAICCTKSGPTIDAWAWEFAGRGGVPEEAGGKVPTA